MFPHCGDAPLLPLRCGSSFAVLRLEVRYKGIGMAVAHAVVGLQRRHHIQVFHQTRSEKPRPSGRGVKGAGRKAAVLLEVREILYKITV